MLAGPHERVEELARLMMLIDSADLSGLAALRARATILAVELGETRGEGAADVARRIADLAEELVTRGTEDVDAAFRDIRSLLEQLRISVDDRVPLDVRSGAEEHLADFLCESRDHIAVSEAALLALQRDPGNSELLNTVFRAFHTIKGVAGFIDLDPIVSLTHAAEQLLAGAQRGALALDGTDRNALLDACSMLRRLLAALSGSPAPGRQEFDGVIRTLHDCETRPRPSLASVDDSDPQRSRSPLTTPPASCASSNPLIASPKKTVRVSVERIARLVRITDDLAIAQEAVLREAGSSQCGSQLQAALDRTNGIIQDLREHSKSMQTVRLRSTFRKMARLAHDVAQRLGKQVEVVTDGEDVALNRDVVEALHDPLVHLIRNACDHGLEGVEERRRSGKPAAGRVSLRASFEGDSFLLEVADDGRGLPREKILASAEALGFAAASAGARSLPDSEVFRLILLPGLSTAEKITEISGRGMGMDVVRRNIEAMHGGIEIRSSPESGTTLLLRLPRASAVAIGAIARADPAGGVERTFERE